MRAALETFGRASDIDSVDVRDTKTSALAQDPYASYSPELRTLVELDEALSPIVADVAHLRDELARLRRQGEEVEKLLDERQAELANSRLERSRLADECARSQWERAETQASLAKATKRLKGLRTQVIALKYGLFQQEARLADERARAEKRQAETESALADAKKQLDGRVAQVAMLDSELGSLRLRVSELETLQAATRDDTPEPDLAFQLSHDPQPSGYTLSAGDSPNVGEIAEPKGNRFPVARVGRTSLPDDARTRAYLFPEIDWDPRRRPGVNTAASHADKHQSHAGEAQHEEWRDCDDARREARNDL